MNVELGIHAVRLGDITVDSNQNFLIIDDEGEIVDIIIDALEHFGFNGKFLKAQSLSDAKDILMHDKVNYILCDWNLPDGQGIDLLRALKKIERYSEIPFIMVTGDCSVSSMLLSKESGSDDYLVKPFNENDLKLKLCEGWKNHILPKQREVKKLKDRIRFLEEENKKLKSELKS